MVTFISTSPEQTEALGCDWGRAVKRGLVIGITGELGSGKTQLVKGIARGLEIPQRVHSPTFALLNEYSGGRLPLYHIDLYRLETPEEIARAGLTEYFHDPAGVTVVEWMNHWLSGFSETPSNGPFRRVSIDVLGENTRKILYEDLGA